MNERIEALKNVDDLIMNVKVAQGLLISGQLPAAYRHMQNIAKGSVESNPVPPWNAEVSARMRRACLAIKPVVEALAEIEGAMDAAKNARKLMLETEE